MKTPIAVALLLLLALPVLAQAPMNITTLDGTTYNGATITKTDATSITVSYSDGIATIPIASLPPALRQQLHLLTPEEAAAKMKAYADKAAAAAAAQDAADDAAKKALLAGTATQAEANSYYKTREADFLVKYGHPVKIIHDTDSDGLAFHSDVYSSDVPNATFIFVYDADGYINNGTFKGKRILNPDADVKGMAEAVKKIKAAGN